MENPKTVQISDTNINSRQGQQRRFPSATLKGGPACLALDLHDRGRESRSRSQLTPALRRQLLQARLGSANKQSACAAGNIHQTPHPCTTTVGSGTSQGTLTSSSLNRTSDPEGGPALWFAAHLQQTNIVATSRSSARSSSAEDTQSQTAPARSHHRRRSSTSPAHGLSISLDQDGRRASSSQTGALSGGRLQPSQLSPIPGMMCNKLLRDTAARPPQPLECMQPRSRRVLCCVVLCCLPRTFLLSPHTTFFPSFVLQQFAGSACACAWSLWLTVCFFL